MLTDKEEGGGRRKEGEEGEEGVDFFLKSNDPTPEGGEKRPNKNPWGGCL